MAATYETIATQTLGSPSTSITLSSIPATYTDLVLVMLCSFSAATDTIFLRFNGDTANNYSMTQLLGNGTTATSARGTSTTGIYELGNLSTNTTNFDLFKYEIMNYSNTTTNKTVLMRGNTPDVAVSLTTGLWRSTAAINSITLLESSGNNWRTGTQVTLYGIKAA